jgi:hypothetical protein
MVVTHSSLPTLFGSPIASWLIFCFIVALLVIRLRQCIAEGEPPQSQPDVESRAQSAPSPPILLEYASPDVLPRQPASLADVLFLALAVGCYLVACYAQSIMPGGANYSFEWELANFLMTLAALSSVALFVLGMLVILIVGRKRIALVVIVGTWMSGILPVLMLFFAKRWFQGNFA